jgi:hypothetical protein
MDIIFLFRAFDTFVIKVDGGHQPGKCRVLKCDRTTSEMRGPSSRIQIG